MILDVRAGGVYRLGTARAVVLSDEVQYPPGVDGGTVLAAPISRRPPAVHGVRLHEADPVSGHVHLSAANQVPLSVLDGDAELLTGNTLDHIVEAFRIMAHGR